MKRLFAFTFLLALLLAACGPVATSTPTVVVAPVDACQQLPLPPICSLPSPKLAHYSRRKPATRLLLPLVRQDNLRSKLTMEHLLTCLPLLTGVMWMILLKRIWL